MSTVSIEEFNELKSRFDSLSALVTTNQQQAKDNALSIQQNRRDMDISYLVLTGAIVFFMQAGFSMLEAGCVGKKNVINILFKNIMDGSIAAIGFWLIGWGIAYGDTAGGFLGTTDFGISKIYYGAGEAETASDGFEMWFFQWAFAGTAATIVSGSVAERTKFEAYLMYSAVCSVLIYPVVVHWGWGNGWLAKNAMPDDDGAFSPLLRGNQEESNGLLDFGGSGVVHMLGGFSGLTGAILVGPRLGRFDMDGKPVAMPGHNTTMMALGTAILWFGWYGFNCGSTLAISNGAALVAGKVAVTTTISGASGCLMATVIGRIFEKTFDIGLALNGILAALVGITAGCAVVEPWSACLIGVAAAWIYYGAHCMLLRLQIDDPLDAFPIHGCCGAWGLLSSGIFCTDDNVFLSGSTNASAPNSACGRGEQFAVQLIAMLAIATWSLALSGFTFWVMRATVGIRVPEDIESEGLDRSEHGATAYAGSFRIGHQHPPRQVAPEPAGKGEPQAEHHQLPPPPANVTTVVPFGHADSNGWGALGMD